MQARSAGRPHVLLSAAMSADGYIDDASSQRLILSDAADLDQVDELRAASDAILVGANTIRRDDPALLVRSATRRDRRRAHGQPPSPLKVTLTDSGDLNPRSRFFTDVDGAPPLVYAPPAAVRHLSGTLAATVVAVPGQAGRLELTWILSDLAARGVGRLMVEGGASVLAQFLAAGLADELRLAIAPVLVADQAAPRLLAAGYRARMQLAGVAQVGDMAVLRYQLPGVAGAGARTQS